MPRHLRRIPLIDRFFRHLGRKTATGCILWAGGTNRKGYGQLGSGGKYAPVIGAHRASYELFVGHIPDDLHVLHRCDNPPCVNPTHLFLGTNADNKADSVAKGRHRKGERPTCTKLTEADVLAIRERYRRGGVSHRQLAKEYGVAHAQIGNLLRGTSWKHV
jgi:hypothetical protein